MVQYWHHAESEAIGIFTAKEYTDYCNGVNVQPIDEIPEEEFNRLGRIYGFDTRTDHNDFFDNLDYAQKGEEEVAALLETKFKDFKLKGFNHDNKCDIVGVVNGREVTIEVKEDVRTKDTGNVVIECESRGQPSGIMTTKADFWVFRIHTVDGLLTLLFKTNNVKQAIRDRRFHNKRHMAHTDSNNVLYFFRLETLREYALMGL